MPRTVRSPGIAITETWRTWRQVRVADVPRQESRTRTHRRSPLDSKTFVNDYCKCYNKLIRWRAGGKMKYERQSERQKQFRVYRVKKNLHGSNCVIASLD